MNNLRPGLQHGRSAQATNGMMIGISVLERIQSLPDVPLPVMLCIYAGNQMPPYCAKMVRNPEPISGQKLADLPDIILDMLARNPSIHDGAIMVHRNEFDEYFISGWSYRLYPPPPKLDITSNRGSAYNSCAAMSAVADIDAVLLLGSERIEAFMNGCEVESARRYSL